MLMWCHRLGNRYTFIHICIFIYLCIYVCIYNIPSPKLPPTSSPSTYLNSSCSALFFSPSRPPPSFYSPYPSSSPHYHSCIPSFSNSPNSSFTPPSSSPSPLRPPPLHLPLFPPVDMPTLPIALINLESWLIVIRPDSFSHISAPLSTITPKPSWYSPKPLGISHHPLVLTLKPFALLHYHWHLHNAIVNPQKPLVLPVLPLVSLHHLYYPHYPLCYSPQNY